MESTIDAYIALVGLTYDDPNWVLDRKRDLMQIGKKLPGSVEEVMLEERPRMLGEYIKARVNAKGIRIEIEYQEREMDTSVSHGYGHSKLGLSDGKIIKVMEKVHLCHRAIIRVELIQTVSKLCEFIKRAINLHQHVPSVVELYPMLLVTKLDDKYIFSIAMKVAPGRPLVMLWKDIDRRPVAERVIEAIERMADHGYGFSDFALDNIMYDTDTDIFTIIDIKPSDFGRNRHFMDDSIGNIYAQLFR